VGWLGDGGQVSAKVCLTCPVGEVPDEQTDCQGLLVEARSILTQRRGAAVKQHRNMQRLQRLPFREKSHG
jgi:hypothetical protein